MVKPQYVGKCIFKVLVIVKPQYVGKCIFEVSLKPVSGVRGSD